MGATPNLSGILSALVDGVRIETLPVGDRGLHYGDGLFETIAIRRGSLCLWQEHLARLRLGAERLAIPLPAPELLLRECLDLAQGKGAAALKLILTRGQGGRGYRPPSMPVPRRLMLLYPQPVWQESAWEDGVAVRWCRTILGENPQLAGIKHLNRLEQVMARAEWDADPVAGTCAEGLMCDARGRVVAGTMSNVFVFTGGRLSTPRLDTCGVSGTARSVVMRLVPSLGIPVVEVDLYPADLKAADGVILTNALIGAWPVRRLGEQAFDIRYLPQVLLPRLTEAIFDSGPAGYSALNPPRPGSPP